LAVELSSAKEAEKIESVRGKLKNLQLETVAGERLKETQQAG
jgi:hypothetical protein